MNSDNILPLSISILCAVGVLGFMLLKVLKRRRARNWPTAAGHVESTRVFLQERGENQSMFVAEVRYAYQVLGETHAGVLARDFLLRGRADKWLGGYPSGRALTVRVNPHKPTDSLVLEREQTVPGAQPAAAGK
jgi:uncharacterized protein DUF3592